MAKFEEKAKVGRPKLAEPELIKESWFSIGACLFVAVVMVVCGTHSLTGKTPLDFIKSSKLQGNASKVTVNRVIKVADDSVKIVRVIEPEQKEQRIIKPNGEVTRVIPVK